MFRCAQMSLGLCAVAGHVVMVGSARMFHLLDRFLHLFVTPLQIVPRTCADSAAPATNARASVKMERSFLMYSSLRQNWSPVRDREVSINNPKRPPRSRPAAATHKCILLLRGVPGPFDFDFRAQTQLAGLPHEAGLYAAY